MSPEGKQILDFISYENLSILRVQNSKSFSSVESPIPSPKSGVKSVLNRSFLPERRHEGWSRQTGPFQQHPLRAAWGTHLGESQASSWAPRGGQHSPRIWNPQKEPRGHTWRHLRRQNVQREFQVSPRLTILNLIFVQGPKLILIIKPQSRKSEGIGCPRDKGRPDSDLIIHNPEYLNDSDRASHSTLLKVRTREISD